MHTDAGSEAVNGCQMTMGLYAKPRAMRQREAMKTLDLSGRGKLRAKPDEDGRQVRKA